MGLSHTSDGAQLLTPTASKRHPRISMPNVELDTIVREIMETIIRRDVPWADVDETVRLWFYRPPSLEMGPRLGVVRRNLQLLGRDLFVGTLEEDTPEPPRPLPVFASGRSY